LVDGLFPPGGFRSFNIAVAFDVALGFLGSLGGALVLAAPRLPGLTMQSCSKRFLLAQVRLRSGEKKTVSMHESRLNASGRRKLARQKTSTSP